MVSFYAFPVIFIATVLFKKGTPIKMAGVRTPWTVHPPGLDPPLIIGAFIIRARRVLWQQLERGAESARRLWRIHNPGDDWRDVHGHGTQLPRGQSWRALSRQLSLRRTRPQRLSDPAAQSAARSLLLLRRRPRRRSVQGAVPRPSLKPASLKFLPDL